MAEGLLLDPAADLLEGLPAEFDYVERVDDSDGVLELIVDRVLVPLERVEGGDLHGRGQRRLALLQPLPVHRP